MLKGLTANTEKVFRKLTDLQCINDYTLIGGTALALQIGKRLSEDLDFCKWSINLKTDKPEVDWYSIETELNTIGNVEGKDILGFDQANFIFEGVKLSFIAKQHNLSPVVQSSKIINTHIADIEAIGAMKVEVCMRRSNFRDYYDIYSILKEGFSLKIIINKAIKYSNNTLKTRDALHFLTNSKRFKQDKNFNLLEPVYNITPEEIEEYIKEIVLNEYPR